MWIEHAYIERPQIPYNKYHISLGTRPTVTWSLIAQELVDLIEQLTPYDDVDITINAITRDFLDETTGNYYTCTYQIGSNGQYVGEPTFTVTDGETQVKSSISKEEVEKVWQSNGYEFFEAYGGENYGGSGGGILDLTISVSNGDTWEYVHTGEYDRTFKDFELVVHKETSFKYPYKDNGTNSSKG